MQQEHRKGLTYSAALHLLILFFVIFGLPSFLEPEIPPQPMVIAVDILPISEMTNVKNSDLPLAKEEKPVEKQEEKVPTPPVKSEAPPPPPPPPPKKEEKPEPKKEEKKPEPKKEEKPKKAKEEDLEAVLKALREDAKKDQAKAEVKEKKAKEEAGTKVKAKDAPYDPGLPLSISEMDAIRSQIAKCWSVPAGAKDAHELRVTVRVQLQQDGTVMLVELADDSVGRYASGDSFFRAAADSALRAVRQCSPLKNLPPEKYQTWKDIIMTFDPKEMLF
ncbi:MAG: hypothetical protein SFX19_01100 [Alphaproteobacteria bacterium]|nr:hypothetical protein [Alphaproteobacteria bacterium]